MPVKAKIRFDYKAEAEGRKFFWQKHDLMKVAKEIRERQEKLLRNLPYQGLTFEVLDPEHEVYLIPEDEKNMETAYAPLEILVEAESIEDLMPLTFKEEFRKIKVLEPNGLVLSNADVERFLFRVNEKYRSEVEL